jgi:hypothetical protein
VYSQFTSVGSQPPADGEEDASGDENKRQWECIHCGKQLSGNPTRMKQHLLNLAACPVFLQSEEAKLLRAWTELFFCIALAICYYD